jgi:putative restriction endonuclease
MKLYVGITDGDWYAQLACMSQLDEVNFWQPGGSREFRSLEPGGLFLFKLHSPRNFIVGGGFFAHATRIPVSLAWETFGEANGVRSLVEMRARIEHYRRRATDRLEDYVIGCILLGQPFFFDEPAWIAVPPDWRPNIVQGRGYDLESLTGRSLWKQVEERLPRTSVADVVATASSEPTARFGSPTVVRPRLGQGSFRIVVTDAYERRCAVTRERTLPALEAAHIRPYSDGGEHRVDNGLLLRRDLHALFDEGYVTVTPDLRLEVSRRIREEFENGRDYYAMQGKDLWVPAPATWKPDPALLRWHNEARFRG